MATVINVSPPKKLAAIGVNPSLLAQVAQKNGELALKADGLALTLGSVTHTHKIYAQALFQAATPGAMDLATKAKIKNEIDTFLQAALDNGGGNVHSNSNVDLSNAVTAVAPKAAAPASLDGVSPFVKKLTAQLLLHEPLGPVAIATVPPIPMPSAKGLYCPVRGTDLASRYFMVAVYDTIRVAVRAQGDSMSLRVEGAPTPEQKSALQTLSFTASSKHWSTHLHGVSKAKMKMFLGTLLGALGPALTPSPDLDMIYGKGT